MMKPQLSASGQVSAAPGPVRDRLGERAREAQRRPAGELVEFVSADGFSWHAVAGLLGVAYAETVRWRKGGEVGPDARKRLAKLVAFCETVTEDFGVSHAAAWLETRLSGRHYGTGLDVYAAGRICELAQHAAGQISAADLLRGAGLDDPRCDKFEVFTAADGEKAIRLKDRTAAGV